MDFLGLADGWQVILFVFFLGSMIAIAIALRRRRRRRISNAPPDAPLGEYTHPHPLSMTALMAAHTAAGGDALEENSYEPSWMQTKHNLG